MCAERKSLRYKLVKSSIIFCIGAWPEGLGVGLMKEQGKKVCKATVIRSYNCGQSNNKNSYNGHLLTAAERSKNNLIISISSFSLMWILFICRWSEVNDYSGVEDPMECGLPSKRVKVAPIYTEPPQFSDDDEDDEDYCP